MGVIPGLYGYKPFVLVFPSGLHAKFTFLLLKMSSDSELSIYHMWYKGEGRELSWLYLHLTSSFHYRIILLAFS